MIEISHLTHTYPGNRKVLENIHLSFYPDAKIGVLGVNGSGKSTLLRIMAGIDTDFVGEGWVAEGARVGYLPQEPHLDPALNVRENVMLGVAKQKAILDRYNELAMNYSEETADEMTKLQDQIEAQGLWDLDSKVDQAMDAQLEGRVATREEAEAFAARIGIDVSIATPHQPSLKLRAYADNFRFDRVR